MDAFSVMVGGSWTCDLNRPVAWASKLIVFAGKNRKSVECEHIRSYAQLATLKGLFTRVYGLFHYQTAQGE